MPLKTNPPFRADHVGSLLRPPELMQAYRAHRKGEMDAAGLEEVIQGAIRDVVKLQEDAGLESITDGEFRRTTYISHFCKALDGIEFKPSSFRFYDQSGAEHEFLAPRCTGKVKKSKSLSKIEFDFLKDVTSKTPKSTYPSPATLHFLAGADDPDPDVYANADDFFTDLGQAYADDIAELADLGSTYVQLDDVPFAMLCDDNLRNQLREKGKDPEELVDTYIDLTNAAVKDRPSNMTAAFHICRGNLKGTWLSEGSYQAVAEKIFNRLDVDAFFLEYDTDRAGGFEPLAAVPDDKFVVLGLISSKVPLMENPDHLKARIADAAKYISMDQLGLSPQCGFSSAVIGNPVTVEDEIAKLKLVVDVANDVWG